MTLVIVVLLALGYCVAYMQAPSTAFYNTDLTVLGWGATLLIYGLMRLPSRRGTRIGPHYNGHWMDAIWTAFLVAGAGSAIIALIQYFVPLWADGVWIARPNTPGRAFANLRQPNLLGTLLLMGLCAMPLLMQKASRCAWVTALLLTLGVASTSSRTALLGLLMLAAWAALDKGAPRHVRQLFVGSLWMAFAWWAALWMYGHLGGVVHFGEARLSTGSDISSSRFKIWANTLQLIADHPWLGVGWGDFNFAWTLSAFPDRPVAFFDHTHNLVLQLAVELGIPVALALLALGAWVLWRARGGLRHPDPLQALTARCCLMMLMVVGWHSMLEYPLWYPYFLFPTIFALSVYLSIGWPRAVSKSLAVASRAAPPLYAAVGAVMIAGALYAIWDYQRVVQIFAPYGAKGERPLPERIAEGQKSWLFGHHADYAAVTTASRPSEVFSSFERPLKHLVDARLMIAYAKALNELGHRDEAIYVVQRLREFRHPLGEEFLRRCADPLYAQTAFECDTRPRSFTYKDLRVERFVTGRAPTSATR